MEHNRPCLFVEDTGLAIVKHLVKDHGWDMRIESLPGKGTKVKIEFKGCVLKDVI